MSCRYACLVVCSCTYTRQSPRCLVVLSFCLLAASASCVLSRMLLLALCLLLDSPQLREIVLRSRSLKRSLLGTKPMLPGLSRPKVNRRRTRTDRRRRKLDSFGSLPSFCMHVQPQMSCVLLFHRSPLECLSSLAYLLTRYEDEKPNACSSTKLS